MEPGRLTSRKSRPWVALCAVASLLFAQLAMAAYACPGESAADRTALESAPSAAPGCEGMDSSQPALCQAHCQQAAQSLEKPVTPVVPPAPWMHPIVLPAPEIRTAFAPSGNQRSLLARSTAPPLAIRNCCFRI
jgi:hypothetical protein